MSNIEIIFSLQCFRKIKLYMAWQLTFSLNDLLNGFHLLLNVRRLQYEWWSCTHKMPELGLYYRYLFFFKCLTACQKLYVLLWKQTICSGILQDNVRDISGACNLGKVFEFRKVGCVFKRWWEQEQETNYGKWGECGFLGI